MVDNFAFDLASRSGYRAATHGPPANRALITPFPTPSYTYRARACFDPTYVPLTYLPLAYLPIA